MCFLHMQICEEFPDQLVTQLRGESLKIMLINLDSNCKVMDIWEPYSHIYQKLCYNGKTHNNDEL